MNTNWNDPNFQGFGGRQSPFGKRPPRPKKEHKAIGTPLSRTLINLAVTLIFAAVYFYVVLPPINLQAEEFYFFMLLCCAVYCGCAVLTSGFQGSGAKGYFGFVKKQCRIPMIIAVALVAVAIVGGIVGWQVIRAGAYRDLLTVETGDFATEVEEISYDQIPMLDSDSAARLGSRKLGELADMVSQFEILPSYTQINYQGRPVRVAPIAYADLFKWLTNRGQGLPAYVVVDMVTQEATVTRLPQGMKEIYLYSVVVAVAAVLLMRVAAPWMVAFVSGSSEPIVLENGARYLLWNAPFYAVLGILLSTRYALQSLGNKVLPLFSSVIELVGKVVFVVLFIPKFGYDAVILCEPIIWCVMAAYLVAVYRHDPFVFPKQEKR